MNITEANDTNTLLRYILALGRGGEVPSDDEGREAAERLAAKAHKALSAGLTPDDVTAAWPELLLDNGDPDRTTDDADKDVGGPRIDGTFTLADGTRVPFLLTTQGNYVQWGQPTEILSTTVDTLTKLADVFLDTYVEPRTCQECGIPVDSKPGADEHRFLGDLLCEDCGGVTT